MTGETQPIDLLPIIRGKVIINTLKSPVEPGVDKLTLIARQLEAQGLGSLNHDEADFLADLIAAKQNKRV